MNLRGLLNQTVTVEFKDMDDDLFKLLTGLSKSDAEIVAEVHSLVAAAAPGLSIGTAAIQAALYQDDDAHDTCSLTACLNPLHPGPCKGWKGTLFDTAPAAWHTLEAAKVEKANHVRVKKIEALKAQGKPIPHKLLQPIAAKEHPHAGKTANKASGEAHAAGKAVSDAAGVHVNEPGKVTLGKAIKSQPVALGPKGKKPTVASKGIAHVIAQEKVTPQYKLDKAATITPEQWAGLSGEDKATIRGELAKVKKDGFGPQQKKADELLAKLPEKPPTAVAAEAKHEPKGGATLGGTAPHHVPKTPGEPLSAKNYTPAMKDATDAAGNFANPPKIHALQMTFADRFKAYQKINVEEWKALPDGTKTAIIHDMIGVAAGDSQLHQGFIDASGKAYTPASAWLKRRNIQLPALDQGKIDKFVPQFAKGKPTKTTVQIVIPEKTTVEAKNIFGEHSQITKVNHPGATGEGSGGTGVVDSVKQAAKEAHQAKLKDAVAKQSARAAEDTAKGRTHIEAAEAKPKPLPKHVQNAIDMANGHAPGATWSKNHLTAYQPLTAEEFHGLPKDTQDKITSELGKAINKFLDPKKVQASKDLLAKFGKGPSTPDVDKTPKPKAAEKTVGFSTHLHDHNVTQAQAKETVANTPISHHFLAAKQTAGLLSEENPDGTQHKSNTHAMVEQFIDSQLGPYDDGKILSQPEVSAAIEDTSKALFALKHAQSVHTAKGKAFNKVSTTLAADDGKLSPIEKASLLHYQQHLLSHPVKTDTVTVEQLQKNAAVAIEDLHVKLQAAKKKTTAPKPDDMTPAQISSHVKELLGDDSASLPKLTLTQQQAAVTDGKEFADTVGWKYPGVLTDPVVAAKQGDLAMASTAQLIAKAAEDNFAKHLQDHHLKALTTGLSVTGAHLTDDDKKILGKHAAQMADANGFTEHLETAKKNVDEAIVAFEAAADKALANVSPAEPVKLTDYDQGVIAEAYSAAWDKHAQKAVTYGVKTYASMQKMKAHAQYPSLSMDLTDLKTLAGKLALAHAEEHTASLNVPTDPDTGAMDHGVEFKAWLAAQAKREELTSQFNILHKTAQARLDAIRVDNGLKKRALPKLDTSSVKATAAETGYYKSIGHGAPNFGKPTAGKNFMVAKVGPKAAVVHKTSGDKEADKKLGDAAKAASTPKIENVPAEPVKLGGGADSTISHVPDALKKQITSDFKAMPDGKYLADPAEDIFGNLVNLAAAHGKGVPGGLSVDQVLKTIDETHSSSLGVSNSGMLHKKITDWLGTPDGKAYAEGHASPDVKKVKQISGELDLPSGVALAPGEKVQKLAGPGPHDESLPASAFKAAKSSQAQAAQDAHMKDQGIKWTAKQKAALKSYTGSAYHTYNGYLRGSSGTAQTKQTVVDIQSAMVPLSQHTLLKRGTGWDALPAEFQGDNAAKMVGKTFQEPGFTSTTVAGESGHFSGPLQLEIEAPEGTPAAFVNGISHFKDQENEMLLAAGTKFKVLSVTKKGHQTVMRVRIVGDK